MQNALLVGLSRQVALAREMDVIANNLANMNTSGFKADGAVFEEFVSPTARADNLPAADNRISFVHDRATWIDLSQGPLERTGNPLDVAVNGNGIPGGADAAWRTLHAQWRSADQQQRRAGYREGFQVLGESGPITFQPKDRNITISQDGTISVREGNNAQTESQRGQLRLVSFDQPGRLQKDGTGIFLAPAGVTPQADKSSRVMQGTVEKSNVALGHRNDTHDRSDAQLHPHRQLAVAAGRLASDGDRETFRSTDELIGSRRMNNESTSYSGDWDDGPGTKRPGHLQQHRQHADHRLQAPAR